MSVEAVGENKYRLFWELPRGIDGKRRRDSKVFRGNYEDALKEWRRRQVEIDAGRYQEPSQMTVRQLAERWLTDVKALRLEASTLQNYRDLIEGHIIPDLGDVRIQRLAATDLQTYYRQKLQSGRKDGRGGLSTRTVRYLHNLLLAMFSQAVRWGILQGNPIELAEPPKLHQSEKHVWTEEEAARFVENIQGHRLAAFWALALVTGLREGELLGLRWRDLDFKKGTLTVAQAMKRVKDKDKRFGPPKSRRSRRVISLDEQAVGVLRSHRVLQAQERLLAGAGWIDFGLVFTTREGRPLLPSNMLKLHNRLCHKAGVPRIRPHDMRHTNATILFDHDTDPKTVQERLGHHSVSFTIQTYVHAIRAREEEAARSIGGAVLGKKPSAK